MQVAKGVRIGLSMRFHSLTVSDDVFSLCLGCISSFLHHVEMASNYEKKLRVSIKTDGGLALAELPLSIYSHMSAQLICLGLNYFH